MTVNIVKVESLSVPNFLFFFSFQIFLCYAYKISQVRDHGDKLYDFKSWVTSQTDLFQVQGWKEIIASV